MLWTKSESNSKPDTILQLGDGRILVRKNITEELSAEGNVKYIRTNLSLWQTHQMASKAKGSEN